MVQVKRFAACRDELDAHRRCVDVRMDGSTHKIGTYRDQCRQEMMRYSQCFESPKADEEVSTIAVNHPQCKERKHRLDKCMKVLEKETETKRRMVCEPQYLSAMQCGLNWMVKDFEAYRRRDPSQVAKRGGGVYAP